MSETKLSEELEEAFYERYFDYGDEIETVRVNARKAYAVLKTAYGTAERITSEAEDGERFDESETILAFQTLTLAKHFLDQFVSLLPSEEQEQWKNVIDGVLK